jgi:hypothetical protein
VRSEGFFLHSLCVFFYALSDVLVLVFVFISMLGLTEFFGLNSECHKCLWEVELLLVGDNIVRCKSMKLFLNPS